MINEIGAYDAKTNLPDILRRVEAGEAFTITNRGRPVADLVPSKSRQRDVTANAIENILAAKKVVVAPDDFNSLQEYGRK